MSQLKNLIVFENEITEEMKNLASEAELTLYTLEEVIFKGREAETKTFNEPTPDDCFAFSYTSGTTGDPKGVKLSHKMGIMSSSAVNFRCGPKLEMTEEDSYISYLPAAHSFEQCIFSMSVITGLKCGFFAGDILKLTEDISILKPTLFPSVPRLFNRIYGKIMDGVKAATGIKGWLVNKAIAAKLHNYKNGLGVTHGIYDKLVFKKMKQMLGGNVKVMITGSAPIAGEVLEFLKICFCAPITEGYGMTETMAGSCLTFPDDPQTGVVGGPLQCVKIRLRDIPEMNYMSSSNPP